MIVNPVDARHLTVNSVRGPDSQAGRRTGSAATHRASQGRGHCLPGCCRRTCLLCMHVCPRTCMGRCSDLQEGMTEPLPIPALDFQNKMQSRWDIIRVQMRDLLKTTACAGRATPSPVGAMATSINLPGLQTMRRVQPALLRSPAEWQGVRRGF